MAGEQIEASTSTCTVATTRTRSATVRYRTVPGEVYEAASKDYSYCTVRARLLYGTRTVLQVKRRSNESYISEKRN